MSWSADTGPCHMCIKREGVYRTTDNRSMFTKTCDTCRIECGIAPMWEKFLTHHNGEPEYFERLSVGQGHVYRSKTGHMVWVPRAGAC